MKVKVASSAHSLSRNLPNESGVCGLIKSMWRPMCPSALARLIELGRYILNTIIHTLAFFVCSFSVIEKTLKTA